MGADPVAEFVVPAVLRGARFVPWQAPGRREPARVSAGAFQAAGLPVPELPRAWAYVLLCADRDGQLDVALQAANQLRALGGWPDVPPAEGVV